MTGQKASGKEPGEQRSDSVYDFLYHDARRIGSFLAQFDEAGLLQQVKQIESVAKGTVDEAAATGGVGALIAKAEGHFNTQVSQEGSEGAERLYDPLWANALTLLDYLSERDMIRRDVKAARIGQFVLASGTLEILDAMLLKSVWQVPSMKKVTANIMIQNAQAASGKKLPGAAVSGLEAQAATAVALLGSLPHAVQARLEGEGYSIWCTLGEDSLVVSAADLVLKHGASISGVWNALGILDAFPDSPPAQPETSAVVDMRRNMSQFAGVARQIFGRPYSCFGITPLLIFRSVSS